jgi:putative endonuclease
MAHVYILQSEKNGRYYIGSTNDLGRRLKQHQSGLVKATKFILPLKLVFAQEFSNLEDARSIEYKLKSFKSRKVIEQIIKDGRIMIAGR